MTDRATPKPVVLCVLDGWGDGPDSPMNAIARADTPNWDAMSATNPCGRLDASEHHVGLPSGQMGNSEVGHMNLGAGRIVMQDLPRIDDALRNGLLPTHAELIGFIKTLKSSGRTAHIAGLMSPGGVHSHQDQIAALARQIAEAGVPVAVHAFLDGRDTSPVSGAQYLTDFSAVSGGAKIATICGRYFAMDRDKRWDRVALAYNLLVDATGAQANDPVEAVQLAYENGVTDEFIEPTAISEYAGMQDGDGLLMANFRSDRVREILTALIDPEFDGFLRSRRIEFSANLGLIEYSEALNDMMTPLFPALKVERVFGALLSETGRRQLRISETEKYAHVTFFFNGGREEVFAGEERILVPSPDVATYNLKPEMSAFEVTKKLVQAISSGRFDFILVNYANTDMVGHTGDFTAAVRAVEAVDHCLGRVRDAVIDSGGAMLVTADHGNAELMADPDTGGPHTAHTRNPVPAVLIGCGERVEGLVDGCLADVAPTLLDLMHLPQPSEMSGRSLLTKSGA
ncbi:MAG: 2,3-bisphosphoglycerate-independent phosphoglycerate mutase [Alphaproteobacteria bacterium MarineAlpha4_Bin2]|nr:MAG: 2,3-bisphosphoglycerate-independent phosphoglycerate mutase [Alphaproteobacteria bacterium MarineAlpha4_Bin2]